MPVELLLFPLQPIIFPFFLFLVLMLLLCLQHLVIPCVAFQLLLQLFYFLFPGLQLLFQLIIQFLEFLELLVDQLYLLVLCLHFELFLVCFLFNGCKRLSGLFQLDLLPVNAFVLLFFSFLILFHHHLLSFQLSLLVFHLVFQFLYSYLQFINAFHFHPLHVPNTFLQKSVF